MKIQLEQAKVFKAKQFEELGELRVVSRWESFTKLECEKGFLIVMDERNAITRSLDNAWDFPLVEYRVVSASPDIAHILLSTDNA